MMAAGIPAEAVRLLRCPHCGGGLKATDSSRRCARDHSHDIARQGYVSLFPSGRRTPSGDSPRMVAAREGFLAAGHYAPLSEATGCVGVGPGRRLAQQAHLPGLAYGLGAVRGVELAVDVIYMRLDRAEGDEEVAGDLGVGSARGEQGQHL
jgi:23S rRNA (guanine745-N1)-methyltransferase